ncbi:iron-sulfur cluster biosynthesis family protein [Rossellomorea aquimaris]|nr:iron-sulfur cluster biosynthesis family protein [Rossellomorea aquimaris]WRP08737.1 iron-sulfur cluster biosynthesis family protein [Rossellomorea aquimaris]
MKLKITKSAKERLNDIPDGKIIQLSLDRGSCDIVNNLYEIKVVENREADSTENIIQSDDMFFIVDDDFEDTYEHELTIDFKDNFFVFKNKNQTFNNRIGLKYV